MTVAAVFLDLEGPSDALLRFFTDVESDMVANMCVGRRQRLRLVMSQVG